MMSVEISRWDQLWRGSFTNFVFPKQVILHDDGIKIVTTRCWWMPWIKEDEHMVFRRVAGQRHIRGLFWDTVTLDSPGGSAILEIKGLPKSKAEALVAEVNRRIADKPKKEAKRELPLRNEREEQSLSMMGRLRRRLV